MMIQDYKIILIWKEKKNIIHTTTKIISQNIIERFKKLIIKANRERVNIIEQ